MANAGRVAIVPKGDWDSSEAYKRLDAVTYNNILYIAKKVVPKNTAVTNTDYWMPSVAGGVAVKATTTNIGQVQPDGETIEVDADGKISAKTALDTKPTIIATAEPNIVDTVEAPMLVTKATRNLLKPTLKTTTQNGVTCTNNGDGTYTLNGTNTLSGNPTSTIWINIASVTLPNQKAVLLGSNNPKVGVYITGETSMMFGDGSVEILESEYGKTVGFGIAIAYEATLDNVVVKPMLTTDLSATYDDFVPYDGYEIKSCGKNLLKSAIDTDANNGITFTRNDDGTYSLSGSRTDTSISAYTTFIKNFPLEKGKYKLTGAVDENNYIRCIIKESASENRNIFDYGDGVVLDVNETDTTITLLIVSTDDTSQTRIIKPMLTTDLYATYDDFVPYKDGGTVQITPSTEFPLLGLKSFDGETNIISPGNVEVTFAKSDSGKAILGMCKPTVKNLVSTVEGNPLDATMGAQLKKEIDELKAKVDAMSTSTTTE